MRLISSGDPSDYGEPDGPGESGPRLYDSLLNTLLACRFSGQPLEDEGPCPSREARQHPDVECRGLYVSVEALPRYLASLPANQRQPGWGR